ncbi:MULTISPECIES: FAD-dependent oxidoreductase [Okeania]|uniref:FAD-dependent oxidoreductase n=1 Tax=Okeania hirsuta TaxID=1458930 RepID=A0A3N6PZV1_9CYAN|nr:MULTISPECIES: FAD-dependent oxidoreductase [Okeania]NES76397.1 FAD-dependent oxidoreductase [Okeania sp. SIO1H4]NES89641.1 FAD-dependent oxidoreductase [Okeania sp. SIO2B9]NET19844.1 FAD-dependent oxidoreductase [Okeania sp. SIO1H5]NET78209.1 FAD-dependent oxidoreductase [Okeania sp. SIO1F9]NET94726.1 FAD-dependent oxidoreductase [Okeania sp. SIO1H2]
MSSNFPKKLILITALLSLIPLSTAQYLPQVSNNFISTFWQKLTTANTSNNSLTTAAPSPSVSKLPKPPLATYKNFDIVIYGDELQGICAAISAKKTLGKTGKVVLIRSNSENAALGGLLTRSGLAYLDYDKTPDWQYRPYSQCFLNFLKKAKVVEACVAPDKATKAMKEMLEAAGIVVISNASLTPYVENRKIKFVQIDDTNIRVKAAAFIDSTQDAELARKAGVPYYLGFASQNPQLWDETIATSIVPTVTGLSIYEFKKIESKILFNRQKMAKIKTKIQADQAPTDAKFTLKKFRLPIIKTYKDGYINRSIALAGAYHIHRKHSFNLDLSSVFLFDKLNICRVGQRELSLNGFLFKYNSQKVREIENNNFQPTQDMITEMQELEAWLRKMSGKDVKVILPSEVYIRHSLNITDVVDPLTGKEILQGGTSAENSIGTFSYEFDFRGGVKGLGINYLPLPIYNFGIESALAKNVNNLAVVGRSSGYIGIAVAVARIQTMSIYQGQAIGVAAAMANQKGIPLNQITSAEVREKLEQLTGKKTKLRGENRTGSRDYSHVK